MKKNHSLWIDGFRLAGVGAVLGAFLLIPFCGIVVGSAAEKNAAVVSLPGPGRMAAVFLGSILGLPAAGWLLAVLYRSLRGGDRSEAFRRAAGALSPLALAALPAVLLPAALIAPSRLLVGIAVDLWRPWLVALAAVGVFSVGSLLLDPAPAWAVRLRSRRFRMPAAGVFLISLAVVLLLRIPPIPLVPDPEEAGAYLTGDEPSYYIMTHSLVTDGDLDLADNIENADWECFGGNPTGGHSASSPYGGRFSHHRPGMPFLMAIPYWIGLKTAMGPRGAVTLMMNLLAALATTFMFLLAKRVTGRDLPALAAAIPAAATFPFVAYASEAYPEMAAALITAIVVGILLDPGAAGWRIVAAAGLIGFLPWLHERYLPLVIVLVGLSAWTFRRRRRVLPFAGAVLAFSALLLLLYMFRLYGAPAPSLSESLPDPGIRAGFGAVGILLDAGEGLVPANPWLLMLGLGYVLLARRSRGSCLVLSAPAAAYFALIAAFPIWWGGFCPVGRYMVVLVPLVVPALALAMEAAPYLGTLLAAGGAALAVFAHRHPAELYLHRHMLARTFAFLDSHRLFPDLLRHGTEVRSYVLAAWWILLAAGLLLYVRRRRPETPPGEQGARTYKTVWGALVLTALIAELLFPEKSVARRGPLEDLWRKRAADGDRGVMLATPVRGYDPYTIVRAQGIFYEAEGSIMAPEAERIEDPAASDGLAVRIERETSGRRPALWGQYAELPPGRYRARFRLRGDSGREGRIILDVARSGGREELGLREIPARILDPAFFRPFDVAFALERTSKRMEFRVYTEGSVALEIDAVSIHRDCRAAGGSTAPE